MGVISTMFGSCGIEISHEAEWLKAVSDNYVHCNYFLYITVCMSIKRFNEWLHETAHENANKISGQVTWSQDTSSKHVMDQLNGLETSDKVCLNISM